MRRTQSQGSAVLCCPWLGLWCSGSGGETRDLDDIEGGVLPNNYYSSGGNLRMGAGLSAGHHHQQGGNGGYHLQSYHSQSGGGGGYHLQSYSGGQQDGGGAPVTMAEVVRERKRKINGGLATLRRRLLAGKRGGRGARAQDRAAPLRDMLREWSPSEVAALLEEYEALAALRDLVVQAELARPPAAALRGDLASLYDNKICPDVELVFKGSSFPVHRAILSARCPYFRDLLNNYPNTTPRISLEVGTLTQHVDPAGLDVLLRYLYTGEPAPQCNNDGNTCEGSNNRRRQNNTSVPDCCQTKNDHNSKRGVQGRLALDIVGANTSNNSANQWHNNTTNRGSSSSSSSAMVNIEPAVLRRLAHELGSQPAQLHRDMKHLLDSGENADATLVFTWEPAPQPTNANPSGSPSPEFPYNGNGNRGQSSSQQQHHHHPRHHNASSNNNNNSAGGTQHDNNAGTNNNTSSNNSWDYGFRPKMEMACHRAVLSARSPFFRSVIQRRFKLKPMDQHSTVKIVLDERVIPHKYARVLLHAVYTDQVDLNLVMRGSSSIFSCSLLGNHGNSLGEAQALTGSHQSGGSGQGSRGQSAAGSSGNNSHVPSPLEEAMELYEIGRFLELDILSQGCEDIIAERLSATSLAAVLKWSSQPHGSKWVHRQALRYLREEFLTVASSPALPQIEKQHLCHTLRCPFLQASELDALRAVLRWGEHRLVKRMEDREPNLLTHTAHSVSRKGVKKRDLSDTELREVLAEVLPFVRIDHILPQNSELLTQAIRRGLVSSPPSCMLGGDDNGTLCSRADAWLRGKGGAGVYVRPRLYMPYYEEVKALLEDQMVQETELVRMRRARYIPDIPDTLYMVSAEPRARSSASVATAESPGGGVPTARSHTPDHSSDHHRRQGSASSPSQMVTSQLSSTLEGQGSTSSSGGGAGGTQGGAQQPPPPSPRLLRAVLERERELRRSAACVRATSLPLSHTTEITRQIRLRVVREFNLPDSVADTLEGVVLEGEGGEGGQEAATPQEGTLDSHTDQRRQNSKDGRDWNESPANSKHHNAYYPNDDRTSSLDSTGSRNRRCIQNVRGLSDAMPDVAMATSSLSRLRISSHNSQETMSSHPTSNMHCVTPDAANMEDNALIKTYNPPEAFRYPTEQEDSYLEDKGESRLSNIGFNSMSREQSTKLESEVGGSGSSNRRSGEFGKRSSGSGYSGDVRSSNTFQCSREESAVVDWYCKTIRNYAKMDAYNKGEGYASKVGEKSSDGCLMVAFMNPNQHLLQEGVYRGGNYWRGKGESVSCQQNPAQHGDAGDSVPGMQLDLGDGNQHASPARHSEGVQSSSWNRQNELRSRNSSTLPPDYTTHTQRRSGCPPSPGRPWCGSYTGYLSASVTNSTLTTPTTAQPPNRGFSTLQHRSRSPRAVPGHATLQRPRPVCPLLTSQGQAKTDSSTPTTCNLSGYQCSNALVLNNSNSSNSGKGATTPCGNNGGVNNVASQCVVSNCNVNTNPYNVCNVSANPTSNMISTCTGVANCSGMIVTTSSSQAGSIAGTPMCDKELSVHRSHSAGSISSIGAEVEKKEQKSNVHNVSGFNHPSSFTTNEANILSSSPRHFRSISTLPETLSWDGLSRPNMSRSHYTPDPITWSNQDIQFSRNTQEGNPAYCRSTHDSYGRNQQSDGQFVRNSREYYGNFRMSPFQGDYILYNRGDSPFSCISQQPAPQQQSQAQTQQQQSCSNVSQRPGSCGLADVISGTNYAQGISSRGESPLYSTSRGNSPFRALDGPPNQFSRTSSPYSSGHRMEFTTARNDRLIENYCQNVQRASSPGCRSYSNSSMQRNSPSNFKLQQNARNVLSASPSSVTGQQQKQQRNSPIPNFSQSSLKLQRSVTDISSSLTYSGSQKQQRVCSSPNYQKCAGDLETYGQSGYSVKSSRSVAQSPSLSSMMGKQEANQDGGGGSNQQGNAGEMAMLRESRHSVGGSHTSQSDERFYKMSTNPQYQMSSSGNTPRYL